MKMKNRSRRDSTTRLPQEFFTNLLEVVSSFTAPNLMQKYHDTKERRDRYLREEWTVIQENSAPKVFRQIDYEYLLTLINLQYEDDTTKLFQPYLSMVRVCLQFGEMQKAHDLLEVLEKHYTEYGLREQSQFLMLKGKWALQARELDLAEKCYTDALELFARLNETHGMVKALNNLGILSLELWDIEQGKEYFIQAERMVSQSKTPVEPAITVFVKMNLGILGGLQGDYEEACKRFEQLENDFPALETETRHKLLLNKGVALKHLHRFDEARATLQQAARGAWDIPNYYIFSDATLELAEIEIREENHDEGIQHLSTAFKILAKMHDRASLADAYRIFGILYMQQEYNELAESQFKMSLHLAREYGNLQYLTEIYYDYSQFAKNKGDRDAQVQYLEKSLAFARVMDATKKVHNLEKALQRVETG